MWRRALYTLKNIIVDVQLHSPNREVFAKKTCRTFYSRYVDKKTENSEEQDQELCEKVCGRIIYTKKFFCKAF